MFLGKDYSECKIKELKFNELTMEDLEALQAYTKRRPGEMICGVIAAALAVFLLVWAWILSGNGLWYGVAVSVLSLILLVVAWSFAGKLKLNAKGAIHGEIETASYESAANGEATDAVDYFATIVFPSSKQRVVHQQVPRILFPKQHGPKEGTEIIIFKLSGKKHIPVYPKYAKKQRRMTYKG